MINLKFGNGFDLIRNIDDSSIDCIVTDPPYGIKYKSWDYINFEEFTEKWLKECFRVLKDGGTIWSFMGYSNVIEFISIAKRYYNVDLNNWSIWVRSKGRSSKKHLKSQREDIVYMTKGKAKTWNPLSIKREVIAPYVKDGRPRGWVLDQDTGLRIRWTGAGNVFFYSAPQWNSICEKQYHPSQKPIMLLQRLILGSSNKGDSILDPFMGSGSCAVACKTLDRNFIGFESNQEYFNYAESWINNLDISKFTEYNLYTDKMLQQKNE